MHPDVHNMHNSANSRKACRSLCSVSPYLHITRRPEQQTKMGSSRDLSRNVMLSVKQSTNFLISLHAAWARPATRGPTLQRASACGVESQSPRVLVESKWAHCCEAWATQNKPHIGRHHTSVGPYGRTTRALYSLLVLVHIIQGVLRVLT